MDGENEIFAPVRCCLIIVTIIFTMFVTNIAKLATNNLEFYLILLIVVNRSLLLDILAMFTFASPKKIRPNCMEKDLEITFFFTTKKGIFMANKIPTFLGAVDCMTKSTQIAICPN